jgi:hypothetical protein
MLYLDGRGVPRDYVQAHMWFTLANFEPNLSLAKAHVTPEQILEAERFAAEWKSQDNTLESCHRNADHRPFLLLVKIEIRRAIGTEIGETVKVLLKQRIRTQRKRRTLKS